MQSWINNIKNHEKSVFSQGGQDGVLEYIIRHVGTINNPPVCIEIGFNSDSLTIGSGANTANLILNNGWNGLLFDGKYEQPNINLHKEFLTSKNICSILKKYDVVQEPDYVSIDIDSCDLWIFKAMLSEYSPRIVSVEYNCNFPIDMAITFPDDPNEIWKGDRVYGASLKALDIVATKFGYSLIHVVPMIDAFFVRNDLLKGIERPALKTFSSMCGLSFHRPCTSGREKILIDYEVYTHSDGNLQGAKKSYKFIKGNIITNFLWKIRKQLRKVNMSKKT